MSTASITLPPSGAATRATPRVWRAGLAASAAWLALAALTALWPNKEIGFSDWAYTQEFAVAAWGVAACVFVAKAAPVSAKMHISVKTQTNFFMPFPQFQNMSVCCCSGNRQNHASGKCYFLTLIHSI